MIMEWIRAVYLEIDYEEDFCSRKGGSAKSTWVSWGLLRLPRLGGGVGWSCGGGCGFGLGSATVELWVLAGLPRWERGGGWIGGIAGCVVGCGWGLRVGWARCWIDTLIVMMDDGGLRGNLMIDDEDG